VRQPRTRGFYAPHNWVKDTSNPSEVGSIQSENDNFGTIQRRRLVSQTKDRASSDTPSSVSGTQHELDDEDEDTEERLEQEGPAYDGLERRTSKSSVKSRENAKRSILLPCSQCVSGGLGLRHDAECAANFEQGDNNEEVPSHSNTKTNTEADKKDSALDLGCSHSESLDFKQAMADLQKTFGDPLPYLRDEEAPEPPAISLLGSVSGLCSTTEAEEKGQQKPTVKSATLSPVRLETKKSNPPISLAISSGTGQQQQQQQQLQPISWMPTDSSFRGPTGLIVTESRLQMMKNNRTNQYVCRFDGCFRYGGHHDGELYFYHYYGPFARHMEEKHNVIVLPDRCKVSLHRFEVSRADGEVVGYRCTGLACPEGNKLYPPNLVSSFQKHMDHAHSFVVESSVTSPMNVPAPGAQGLRVDAIPERLSSGAIESSSVLMGQNISGGTARDLSEALCGVARDMGRTLAVGQRTQVEALLNQGADPDHLGIQGDTPLLLAAGYGKIGVAMALLEAGADVNKAGRFGDTPLHRACFHLRTDLVRLLLKHGADPQARDYKGQVPGTKFKPRSRPQEEKAVHDIITYYQKQPGPACMMSQIVKDGRYVCPFSQSKFEHFYAQTAASPICSPKNLVYVAILSQHLLDAHSRELIVDQEYRGLGERLFEAARTGKVLELAALLSKGADPNYESKCGSAEFSELSGTGVGGSTSLLVAIEYGHEAVVKFLLEHGANVNKGDRGQRRPLHIACEKNPSPTIISMLLERGARPLLKNRRGQTAEDCLKKVGGPTVENALLLIAEAATAQSSRASSTVTDEESGFVATQSRALSDEEDMSSPTMISEQQPSSPVQSEPFQMSEGGGFRQLFPVVTLRSSPVPDVMNSVPSSEGEAPEPQNLPEKSSDLPWGASQSFTNKELHKDSVEDIDFSANKGKLGLLERSQSCPLDLHSKRSVTDSGEVKAAEQIKNLLDFSKLSSVTEDRPSWNSERSLKWAPKVKEVNHTLAEKALSQANIAEHSIFQQKEMRRSFSKQASIDDDIFGADYVRTEGLKDRARSISAHDGQTSSSDLLRSPPRTPPAPISRSPQRSPPHSVDFELDRSHTEVLTVSLKCAQCGNAGHANKECVLRLPELSCWEEMADDTPRQSGSKGPAYAFDENQNTPNIEIGSLPSTPRFLQGSRLVFENLGRDSDESPASVEGASFSINPGAADRVEDVPPSHTDEILSDLLTTSAPPLSVSAQEVESATLTVPSSTLASAPQLNKVGNAFEIEAALSAAGHIATLETERHLLTSPSTPTSEHPAETSNLNSVAEQSVISSWEEMADEQPLVSSALQQGNCSGVNPAHPALPGSKLPNEELAAERALLTSWKVTANGQSCAKTVLKREESPKKLESPKKAGVQLMCTYQDLYT